MVENDRNDDALETTGGRIVDPRDFEIELDEQDVDDIRDFVDRVESIEEGPADPGLEAMVQVARLILEDHDDQGEA